MALLTISSTACGQNKSERLILGKSYAQQELKSALTDKEQHNVIDNKSVIIKDSLTAINTAEAILFSIYGKDNITKQRPYETYLIDNHWVISGTLPKGYLGGTFLIIINAFDNKIIKITHGK
ncbi:MULTISPECIES: NTF2 fold immunity protein [unclassified Chryseobacterium]|uniref:NTF2 fold immunity protein n=1 Tax=unclassified Chryseobacterium TaxID=2593645 RepID=UPI000AA5FBD9|nr:MULTISPECIES: NTF2 fold immunity protein [unclassified Chryseobacterium]